MKWLLLILIPIFGACSTGPSSMEHGGRITAELVPTKLVHSFHDASAVSFDQFLNFYVVEPSSNSVMKFSASGDSIRCVSGFGSEHNQFNSPVDVDARLTNTVFIADNLNHRVEQYSKELSYVSTYFTRDSRTSEKRFGYPRAVAEDDAGNVYIADGENKRVLKIRPDYTVDRTIGGYGEATRPEALLTNPIDIAVDRNERLIVLDHGGSSLVTFDDLGNLLARTELSGVGMSIAVANDTAFVLVAKDKSIQLYRSPDLAHIGSWKVDLDPSTDPSTISGFAVRSGNVCLSTRQGVYLCKIRSVSADSHFPY